MTLQAIAQDSGKTLRTIQRWVDKYNEKYGTDHGKGKNYVVKDENLIGFIADQGGAVTTKKLTDEKPTQPKGEFPAIEFGTYKYPVADSTPKKYGFTQKFVYIDSKGEEHDLATNDNNNRTLGVSEASEIGPGDGVELPFIEEQPEIYAQAHTSYTDVNFITRLINLLPVLPLPMLGMAASYGVYFFASQFVPTFVAVAEAAAFELIYIGLAALTGLSEQRRQLARRVSIGAVVVSVIYNTLAGAVELQPDLLTDLPNVAFWSICVVHGAPLAVLAFYVSDLLFHAKDK